MKKFLIIYWFNIILLFALFYLDISPIADILNNFQTNFTSYLTSLTLPINKMQGNEIIINPHYNLVIEKACNGLIPYLFFLSSIIAFPSNIKHKFKWVIYGYIVITGINIFRIWLITQLVLQKTDNFSIAHNVIGNSILILSSITLFVLFVRLTKNQK